MTKDRTARPVSGEIMSGTRPADDSAAAGIDRADIVEADFETLAPESAGSERPRPIAYAEPVPGMDMLRARQARAERQRGGPLFWAFGIMLVVLAFWISGGHALVTSRSTVPQRQPLTAGQPLRIENVTSRVETQGRDMVLLVDGEVLNAGQSRQAVPGLSIRVTGNDGRTIRYFLGTNDHMLDSGGRFAFSSRLAAPKDGLGTVTVDFRREGEN